MSFSSKRLGRTGSFIREKLGKLGSAVSTRPYRVSPSLQGTRDAMMASKSLSDIPTAVMTGAQACIRREDRNVGLLVDRFDMYQPEVIKTEVTSYDVPTKIRLPNGTVVIGTKRVEERVPPPRKNKGQKGKKNPPVPPKPKKPNPESVEPSAPPVSVPHQEVSHMVAEQKAPYYPILDMGEDDVVSPFDAFTLDTDTINQAGMKPPPRTVERDPQLYDPDYPVLPRKVFRRISSYSLPKYWFMIDPPMPGKPLCECQMLGQHSHPVDTVMRSGHASLMDMSATGLNPAPIYIADRAKSAPRPVPRMCNHQLPLPIPRTCSLPEDLGLVSDVTPMPHVPISSGGPLLAVSYGNAYHHNMVPDFEQGTDPGLMGRVPASQYGLTKNHMQKFFLPAAGLTVRGAGKLDYEQQGFDQQGNLLEKTVVETTLVWTDPKALGQKAVGKYKKEVSALVAGLGFHMDTLVFGQTATSLTISVPIWGEKASSEALYARRYDQKDPLLSQIWDSVIATNVINYPAFRNTLVHNMGLGGSQSGLVPSFLTACALYPAVVPRDTKLTAGLFQITHYIYLERRLSVV